MARVDSLLFTGPGEVEVITEELASPACGEVSVRAIRSGISAGTELLIYRGQAPKSMIQDTSISALQGCLEYPLKYGYSMVGQVEECGPGVDDSLKGRHIFAFQPHQSRFTMSVKDLIVLPPDLPPHSAIFLPNLETAVNLVQDGAPIVGDSVAVFGQGVVGLLTTSLLSRFPLTKLVTVDPLEERRNRSLMMGATRSYPPLEFRDTNFDLSYELSGAPQALNQALAGTRYCGTVVVGSWYGTKKVELDLGGDFHRSRIEIKASQVSTVAPNLSGRWDKGRRMELCLDLLSTIDVQELVTHTFPLDEADQAFSLLDQHPQEALQVVLTYP